LPWFSKEQSIVTELQQVLRRLTADSGRQSNVATVLRAAHDELERRDVEDGKRPWRDRVGAGSRAGFAIILPPETRL
jgi:hypothetical protein